MGAIDIYLKEIRRRYPGTQAVREQIEELRDTLHLKTEELQAQGKTYDEAAREAIASMGDVSHLFDEVSGNVKTVYINLLNRNNSIFCSLIILAEFLAGWLVVLLNAGLDATYWWFTLPLLGILLGLGVWVAAAVIAYKREPLKTEVVDYQFRRHMKIAVIGWLCLSLLLLGINLWIGVYMRPNTIWFQWPVIGIANWPLNIWLYHRQLTSGHYDA
ncbi:MAG: permease prefix domain 1-containing protein [Burkholderiales bacterium]